LAPTQTLPFNGGWFIMNDPCAGEKNALIGAKAAAAAAWLAIGPACVPSPLAPVSCPLAIAAAIGAVIQAIGAAQQYTKCLRPPKEPAPRGGATPIAAADAIDQAFEAIAAELAQLQAFYDQIAGSASVA
jgi:hypothetical protein